MTLKDIIEKVMGLDPTKDYNLSLDEIDEKSVVEPTQEKTKRDDTVLENSSTIELEQIKKQLDEVTTQNKLLRETNEQLKTINKELFLRTPAEPEKSVEQRILEMCVPNAGKGE